MDNSRISVNPEREMQQVEAGRYYENPRTQRSNSLNEHQYIQLIPKPYYANLENQR